MGNNKSLVFDFKSILKTQFSSVTVEERIQFLNSLIQRRSLAGTQLVDDQPKLDFQSLKLLIEYSYYIVSLPYVPGPVQKFNATVGGNVLSELVNATVTYYLSDSLERNADEIAELDFFVSHLNYDYVEAPQYLEYFEYFKEELEEYLGFTNSFNFVRMLLATSVVRVDQVYGDLLPDFLTMGVPIDQLERLYPGIGDTLISSESFQNEFDNINYPTDIENLLNNAKVPAIQHNGLVFIPNSINIVQYIAVGLRRYIKPRGKKAMRFQHKHEGFLKKVITEKVANRETDISVVTNFFVSVVNGREHDLLLLWQNYAFVIELKTADIEFNSMNAAGSLLSLQRKYSSVIGKAMIQEQDAEIELRNNRKYFTREGDAKSKQILPKRVKKFNGVILTGKNYQSLAHNQERYSKDSNVLKSVMSIFDFEIIFAWTVHFRNPKFLSDYLTWRVQQHTMNMIVDISMDEIALFEYFVMFEGKTHQDIPIVLSSQGGTSILLWYQNEYSRRDELMSTNFMSQWMEKFLADDETNVFEDIKS
ncbi:hypothetical protein [Leuconostoc lactis]|uniref:hypothetical protein n=1 Tax=Leuconostoc lactis TaxID=1246 RepID=UPI001898B7BF|nr:hypothetical protein [Leuconostoc lactis]